MVDVQAKIFLFSFQNSINYDRYKINIFYVYVAWLEIKYIHFTLKASLKKIIHKGYIVKSAWCDI